jgi:hypothetical protein
MQVDSENSKRSRRPDPQALVQATLLATALVLGAACTAQIDRFVAAPDRICRGAGTIVSWSVQGTAELAADPPVPGTGPVEASGSRQFSLERPTRFVLTAHTLFQQSEPGVQQVKVFERESEQEIMGPTTCRPGSVVASISLPRGDADELVRVESVEIVGSRRVKVEHEGHAAALNLGQRTSAEFAGATPSGEWKLSSLLLPGEICGDAEHSPPDALHLKITTRCRESTP